VYIRGISTFLPAEKADWEKGKKQREKGRMKKTKIFFWLS
jgi:hypothetical protein